MSEFKIAKDIQKILRVIECLKNIQVNSLPDINDCRDIVIFEDQLYMKTSSGWQVSAGGGGGGPHTHVAADITDLNTVLNARQSATEAYADGLFETVIGTPIPAVAFDTIAEIAAELASDNASEAVILTALGNRVRFDINNQGLSLVEKTNAQTNIGLQNAVITDVVQDITAQKTFKSTVVPYLANTVIDGWRIEITSPTDYPGQIIDLNVETGVSVNNSTTSSYSAMQDYRVIIERGTSGHTVGAEDVLRKDEIEALIAASSGNSIWVEEIKITSSGNNALSSFGTVASGTGTGNTAAVAQSNTLKLRNYKRTNYAAVAAANAVVGVRTPANQFHNGIYQGGGMKIKSRVGITTGLELSASNRFFIGINGNANAAPTDVNPSSKTNIVGFAWDSGDTYIYLMNNDGTGTATKTITTVLKPTVNEADVLEFYLINMPGTTVYDLYIKNLVTGVISSHTVSTDIPLLSGVCYFDTYFSVGGNNSVGPTMSFIDLYAYTT